MGGGGRAAWQGPGAVIRGLSPVGARKSLGLHPPLEGGVLWAGDCYFGAGDWGPEGWGPSR